MLAISAAAYLVANGFYKFQIFLLWVNFAPGASAGRLSLGHICCILLEDQSFFFISTIDTLVGKQQDIPVATSGTSVCMIDHTFAPENVSSTVGLLRRWNNSSFLNILKYAGAMSSRKRNLS